MKTAPSILLCLFSAVMFMAVQAGNTYPTYPTKPTQNPPNICYGKEEGEVVELDCYGYKVCQGGQLITLKCPDGLVLDRRDKLCYVIGTGHTACGTPGNCKGLPDGNYPDVKYGCHSFIACAGGIFYGRLFCPDGLIFNQAKNQCDYPQNVPYPCGHTHDPYVQEPHVHKSHVQSAPAPMTHHDHHDDDK